MDNEEDYIELHRLLAKCKFNLVKEQIEYCIRKADSDFMIEDKFKTNCYDKKVRQIDEFIVDIPIIIKGDER